MNWIWSLESAQALGRRSDRLGFVLSPCRVNQSEHRDGSSSKLNTILTHLWLLRATHFSFTISHKSYKTINTFWSSRELSKALPQNWRSPIRTCILSQAWPEKHDDLLLNGVFRTFIELHSFPRTEDIFNSSSITNGGTHLCYYLGGILVLTRMEKIEVRRENLYRTVRTREKLFGRNQHVATVPNLNRLNPTQGVVIFAEVKFKLNITRIIACCGMMF